jgi:D-alanine-D-alanine ligase
MKTIAVIFGGSTTEHDVSIVTALASVIKPLELTKKYQVEALYISKDGSWYCDEKLKDIKLYQSGEIESFIQKTSKVQLLFNQGLTLVKSGRISSHKKRYKIDIIFPAMHGTYGEDGSLMGLLEMANLPYVGCSMSASVIAMDKVLAKQVTEASGIKSTPWVWFYSKKLYDDSEGVLSSIKKLKYPLFVKPAHLGSSIGISKVEKPSDLMNALEVAAHYDDKVIVEQAVQNLIEVTLPIIGNENPKAALLERPLVSADNFFDFETKYMSGGKKGKGGGKKSAQGYSEIPAKLLKALYEKAETVGLNTYKAIGCSGISRVDMLIDEKTQEVYFNEVNPMPGDLYAHNFRMAGISNVELVERLVNLAEESWKSKQKITTTFSTSYLKQF